MVNYLDLILNAVGRDSAYHHRLRMLCVTGCSERTAADAHTVLARIGASLMRTARITTDHEPPNGLRRSRSVQLPRS